MISSSPSKSTFMASTQPHQHLPSRPVHISLASASTSRSEPDEQWKRNTRRTISESLSFMIKQAEANLKHQLQEAPSLRAKHQAEFERIVEKIRQLEKEEFEHELNKERIIRKRLIGQTTSPTFNDALRAEQMLIVEQIVKEESVKSDSIGTTPSFSLDLTIF
jgi:hypothetical protein